MGAGLEEITVLAKLQEDPNGPARDVALRFGSAAGSGPLVQVTDPPTEAIEPLDNYTQKVQRAAARGLVYPYEIVPAADQARGAPSPSTTSTRPAPTGR